MTSEDSASVIIYNETPDESNKVALEGQSTGLVILENGVQVSAEENEYVFMADVDEINDDNVTNAGEKLEEKDEVIVMEIVEEDLLDDVTDKSVSYQLIVSDNSNVTEIENELDRSRDTIEVGQIDAPFIIENVHEKCLPETTPAIKMDHLNYVDYVYANKNDHPTGLSINDRMLSPDSGESIAIIGQELSENSKEEEEIISLSAGCITSECDQQSEILNMMINQDQCNINASGTKIITIPVSIDGEIQELPIELPEWADLSQQNLVAVAEDGTAIPLSVIQNVNNCNPTVEVNQPDFSSISSNSNESNLLKINQVLSSSVNSKRNEHLKANRPKTAPKSLKDIMSLTCGARKKSSIQPTNVNKVVNEMHASSRIPEKLISPMEVQPIKRRQQKTAVKNLDPTTNAQSHFTTSNHTGNITIKATKERDQCKIELSNITESAISPDNMQTLIQILQALPTNSRSQTVQIILQSEAIDGGEQVTTTSTIVNPDKSVPSTPTDPVKQTNVTTSDIGTQVCLESLGEVSKENVEGELNIPDPVINSETTEKPESSVDNQGKVPDEENVEVRENTSDPKIKSRNRRSRKKVSKVITVEQQWVEDPEPGVSYYAVVGYLSEQEQDGYSSGAELKRPEAAISGFMEDYLELKDLTDDVKAGSLLESTVDSSVVVPPLRKSKIKASVGMKTTNDPNVIDLPSSESILSSFTISENSCEENVDDDLDEQTATNDCLKFKQTKSRNPRVRHQHCCGYCEFGTRDKILVVEHCILEHPNQPVKTLSLLPRLMSRVCPYCNKDFEPPEFFSHMRFAHNEYHPFKCGYCDFMGRDRNQIRHHIQKKHKLPIKVISLNNATEKAINNNNVSGEVVIEGKKRIMGKPGCISEGEESVYEYMTDEDEDEDDDMDSQKPVQCPECRKTFKTLKYLKTHVKIHQPLRYQCGYCDFTTVMLHQVIRHCQTRHADVEPKVLTKELDPDKNPIVSKDIDSVLRQVHSFNTRLPKDPDSTKWIRKWCCPHCDYTCQFGASYRRHLRMHANVLPYKCNYCSFKGREKYYVRRHIYRMHKDVPMIVIENTAENREMDSSSDEDFQEKGLRRKRRRKMKRMKSVVPLNLFDTHAMNNKFQKLPVGERGNRRKSLSGINSEHASDKKLGTTSDERAVKPPLYPRLLRTSEWSGEKISDYIGGRDGNKIICKACGQKTVHNAFYKHARKHFRVKPFKCAYCNYVSVERTKIKVHISIKHPNAPFRVEECHLGSVLPKVFMDLIGDNDSSTSALNSSEPDQNLPPQQDMIKVLEIPQFNCPMCQEVIYYDENLLRDHFYDHYDYFPFACNECDFKGTSSERVIAHETAEHPGNEMIVYQVDAAKPDGLEEIILQFMGEGEAAVQKRLLEIIEQTNSQTNSTKQTDHEELMFCCPVCSKQLNLHVATIKRHLYSHYHYKPFKCGYCEFYGVSKANIKQHVVSHGSVRPIVEVLKDLPMPEELEKLLNEIQDALNMPLIEKKEEVKSVSSVLKSKIIKIICGECPICDIDIGSSQEDVVSHLKSHLEVDDESDGILSCGYCEEQYETFEEAKIHHNEYHPDLELKIVGSNFASYDERKALLKYVEDNSIIFKKKVEASTTSKKDDVEFLGSSTGKEEDVEYQYVILSDDKKSVHSDDEVGTSGQSYALVLEQGEDGSVRAAKMIQEKDEDIIEVSQRQLKMMDKIEEEESNESMYSEDENNYGGIVTVGGVLLTRSTRSEAEDNNDDIADENLEINDKTFSKESCSTSQDNLSCKFCSHCFNKKSELDLHVSKFHKRKTYEQNKITKIKKIKLDTPEIVIESENELVTLDEVKETVENITKMVMESELLSIINQSESMNELDTQSEEMKLKTSIEINIDQSELIQDEKSKENIVSTSIETKGDVIKM